MNGNIFYSQVKSRVQKEVIARARAGKLNRDTKSMNFMLGVISNAEVVVWKDSTYTEALAKLGGKLSREKYYRPQAFLDIKNESKRTVPFLSSVDLVIGDNSMNILNRATIRLNIPDPLRDLDETERLFFRPGRAVSIRIESPPEALITEAQIDDDPSETETDPDYPRFIEFRGLITSFDYAYQTNGTIDGTLSITGTSNTYTDVSMLISSGPETLEEKQVDSLLSKIPDKKQDVSLKTQQPLNLNANNSFTNSISWDSSNSLPTSPVQTNNVVNTSNPNNSLVTNAEDAAVDVKPINTFYQRLSDDFNKYKEAKEKKSVTPKIFKSTFYQINDSTAPANEPAIIKWGPIYQQFNKEKQKFETTESDYHRYVTLAHLINYINFYIMKKMKSVAETPWIHCSDYPLNYPIPNSKKEIEIEPQFSNYYSELTSINPESILLIGQDGAGKTNTYGDRVIGATVGTAGQQLFFNENEIGHPSRILISMQTIKTISDSLTDTIVKSGKQKTFRIKDFLNLISQEISDATAGAIEMKLITHPDIPDRLLFYDSNFVNYRTTVKEFEIPVWANNANGTIVQDLKITAKIPDNVKNLAYILNQGVEEISDSQIAPYLNVMYADEEEMIDKLKDKYKAIHEDALNKLKLAKEKLGDDPDSKTIQQELKSSLKKYLQYPTPSAVESNRINAPIFPYEIEFTMPGINGFRYGDVLQFSGIPERYRISNVFLIYQITQTIDSAGVWTTKIRCGMRPRLT